MKKINKVKRGLEACIIRNPDDKLRCSKCPYHDPDAYCLNRLKIDALAVINELAPEPTCGPEYCDI